MTLTTDNPADLLASLIRCPSVTPEEAGALTALEDMLTPLGFTVQRVTFEDEGTAPVENLYARLGDTGPTLMYAGHTDVVPVGDPADWSHPPFAAAISDGRMFGRGAVDMKGGIACFVAALARYISRHGKPPGSVALLITGDEEGISINGTEKLLKWAAGKGERWDGCIVGEPTNRARLGDMIKIGRRGSQNGVLTVEGLQGHAAYPHQADNPVRALLPMLENLLEPPLDTGTEHFPATNLEITSIDTGNPAHNVIPARITARFNIRFNDLWTAESLRAELDGRLDRAARDDRFRQGRAPACFRMDWAKRASEAFLTRDNRLIDTVGTAARAVTGLQAELSTTGGTSDARFVRNYCPVVEFGLVSQTMHMVDEHVPLSDLETLTDIYDRVLQRWFGDDAGI